MALPKSPEGDRYRAKIESLISRYGEGVRPGWVSDEIAMNEIYAQAADRQAYLASFKESAS